MGRVRALPLISDIFNYLLYKKYPEGSEDNKKRVIRRAANANFKVIIR